MAAIRSLSCTGLAALRSYAVTNIFIAALVVYDSVNRRVPTCAIICGERVIADHVGYHYDLPNNRNTVEDFLEKLN
jgi:hypothetical protein